MSNWKIKDISGKRFDRLIALSSTNLREGNSVVWQLQCDCGMNTIAALDSLRNGKVKSCGCLRSDTTKKFNITKIEQRVGSRYGRLVVLKLMRKKRRGKRVWQCRCDCGNIAFITSEDFRSTKSCGCLRDAAQFAKGTNINPMDVPFEITNLMKTRRDLRKAIKQAS